MKIVPADDKLEVEALILNRDVGFVRDGEPTEVKVESFPYTRYGTIEGHIETIEADTAGGDQAPPGAARPDQSAYRARVALSRDTMWIDGRKVRLSPGMSVTIDVKTGQRSVLDYILEPMMKYQAESMRER